MPGQARRADRHGLTWLEGQSPPGTYRQDGDVGRRPIVADDLDVPPGPAVAGLRGGAADGVRGAAQGALGGDGELRRPQRACVAGNGGEQRVGDGGGVREQVEVTVRVAEHPEQRRPVRRVVAADQEAAQRGEEQRRVTLWEQPGSAVFEGAPEVAGGPHVDRLPGGGQATRAGWSSSFTVGMPAPRR